MCPTHSAASPAREEAGAPASPQPTSSDPRERARTAYEALHEHVRGAAPSPGDRSLSVAQYDAARSGYLTKHHIRSKPGVAVWSPTSQTLMKDLGDGSWARAMTSLGLTAGTGRARGAAQFDDAAYVATVADFLRDVADETQTEPRTSSFGQFTTWLATQKAGGRVLPSAAAVRKHFGTWDEAKRRTQPSTP